MTKIAGIDVGGTYIKVGIVTTPPNVDDFKSFPTKPARIVEQLTEIISELKVNAAGIGVPGLVKDSVIHYSHNLGVKKELNLQEILYSRLKIPIKVDNDANIVALGEWKYGAGKGLSNLLLLTLGTGVGGGLILDNKLYTGTGFAGEVGHITIDPDGPPCGCGNYGCLESYVGSGHIELKAIQGLKIGINTSLARYKKITPELITREAYKGDSLACSIIGSIGYYLGIGIANLCNVLSLERIIIGGGIAKAGDLLFDRIRAEVKLRLYQRKEIDIVPAHLGDLAGILGGAYSIGAELSVI